MSSGNNPQASLIGGHAEYVKGTAESAIGSVTGSQAWTTSGEQAKAHAVDTMKTAGEQRNASTQGFGKVEQKLGQATGCEGMVKEGSASKRQQ
ncbi:uncharacterized protein GGS25DRAFT_126831 [Hypoxylon fragiforme]|uniref:uncharacterized protein n=1 Tax=Hypoxylon fragiforme TaxID=63214 RepID=UPI0020C667A7|nr:uncharacterized protein GGS25DRAFT_126831 [Hypoxylon fragiforme]KAI2612622.1 hypothetical protein GGS25DRAFT_126831 [Hypoxylon fragiforme]